MEFLQCDNIFSANDTESYYGEGDEQRRVEIKRKLEESEKDRIQISQKVKCRLSELDSIPIRVKLRYRTLSATLQPQTTHKCACTNTTVNTLGVHYSSGIQDKIWKTKIRNQKGRNKFK